MLLTKKTESAFANNKQCSSYQKSSFSKAEGSTFRVLNR